MTDQAHGSAADTGLPSRRALVASLAATSVLSLPATAANSMLSSLVAEHRRAATVHLAAIAAEDEIDSVATGELLEITTRQGLSRVEPDKISRACVEKAVRDSYKGARMFADDAHRVLRNEQVHAMQLAALDAAEAEDLASIRAAYEAYDARPSGQARAEASARTARASDAEDAAMLAICAHRCRTTDEARQKATYLLGPGAWSEEEPLHEHVVALLQSFLPEGGANV